MGDKIRLLLVEDEQTLAGIIADTLSEKGFEVTVAHDGEAGLRAFRGSRPDVVVSDVMMPCMDGFTFVGRLRREAPGVPVLFLSARSAAEDVVQGFETGGNDYLRKPFAMSELLARLRVALRRARQDSGHAGAPEAVFTNGELKIDYAAGCTYLAGQEVHLTPIEYKLLCLLAKNVGKVLTHNFILKEVWGSALPGDTPSLRVFMSTLRKKIEPVPAQPKYIQTHVGVGYRMLRIAEGEPVQKNG